MHDQTVNALNMVHSANHTHTSLQDRCIIATVLLLEEIALRLEGIEQSLDSVADHGIGQAN